MYFDVIRAEYIDEYKIRIQFEDGNNGVVNLDEYAGKGGVFSRFNDIGYFRRFKVESGIIYWGDGELDIAPETLYLRVTGKKKIEWDHVGAMTL